MPLSSLPSTHPQLLPPVLSNWVQNSELFAPHTMHQAHFVLHEPQVGAGALSPYAPYSYHLYPIIYHPIYT